MTTGTSETKVAKTHASNEPVLDLNSILRGKKVRVVTGEEEVAEAYSLVVRVLDKTKQPGFDIRSGITAVVPKSHTMHAPVTALVEYVLAPMTQNEASLFETGKKMLRRVAVDNQENGRREFTSKNVACALGMHPEELGLWSRLDLDKDHGVALCATLAQQSDKAPAQYQFKHLSFQEGLYAEHLLLLVTSLAPPNGPGWPGWASDDKAAEFLNNRYMNNTCRIAAGHLGGLLRLRSALLGLFDRKGQPDAQRPLSSVVHHRRQRQGAEHQRRAERHLGRRRERPRQDDHDVLQPADTLARKQRPAEAHRRVDGRLEHRVRRPLAVVDAHRPQPEQQPPRPGGCPARRQGSAHVHRPQASRLLVQ